MRHHRHILDEDPRRLREAPQSHEIAVKPASEMTDAELKARIGELDVQLKPLIEMKPVES